MQEFEPIDVLWTRSDLTTNTISASTDKRAHGEPSHYLSAIILRAVSFGLPDYRGRLGWFKHNRHLGRGACFSVEERVSNDSTLVAVKHMKATFASHTPTAVANDSLQLALRELQVLTHPPLQRQNYIMQLLGYGWDAVSFYLVQECALGNLRAILKSHSVLPKQKSQFCAEIAHGLAALHSCAILHGDVKQENILVVVDPLGALICKVADFGHAVILSGSLSYTYIGGTTLYAAPECRSRSPLSCELILKTDTFSYGLVCWEILLSGDEYFTSIDQFKSLEVSDIVHKLCTLPPNCMRRSALRQLDTLAPPAKPKFRGFFSTILNATLEEDPQERIHMDELCRKIAASPITSEGKKPEQPLLVDDTVSPDPIELAPYNHPWDTQVIIFQELERSYARLMPEQRAPIAWTLSTSHLIGWGTIKDTSRRLELLQDAQKLGSMAASILLPRLLWSYSEDESHEDDKSSDVTKIMAASKEFSNDPSSTISYTDWCAQMNVALYYGHKESPYDLSAYALESGVSISSQLSARYEDSQHRVIHEICRREGHELIAKVSLTLTTSDLCELLVLQDDNGRLPMHHVCETGNLVLLQFLGERLFPQGAVDNWGCNFLHYLPLFPTHQIEDTAKYIHQRDSELINGSSMFEYDPVLGWERGGSPLHWAVASANQTAVLSLLNLGANALVQAYWPLIRELDDRPVAFQPAAIGITHLITPVSLSVRLHLPNLYRILWNSVSGGLVRSTPSPAVFTLLGHACMAMPYQTRRIIHGPQYLSAFEDTLDAILESFPSLLQIMTDKVAQLAWITVSELHQDPYIVRGLLGRFPSAWYMGLHDRLRFKALCAASYSLTRSPSDAGHLPILLDEFGCGNTVARAPCVRPFPKVSLLDKLIEGNHAVALEMMLKNGAGRSATTLQKINLMIVAINNGAKECLKVMLEHGYSPDLVQEQGFTPLHFAAYRGKIDEAELLIDHGANVYTCTHNAKGQKWPFLEIPCSVFHSALMNDNQNCFIQSFLAKYMNTTLRRELLDCFRLSCPYLYNGKPLDVAAFNGDFPATVALIRAGALPASISPGKTDRCMTSGAAEALEIWMNTKRFQPEGRPPHLQKRLERIHGYLTEMERVQAAEVIKYYTALSITLGEALVGSHTTYDNKKAELRERIRVAVAFREDALFTNLDELPDTLDDLEEVDYEHEPEDVYAASILAIKREVRSIPLAYGCNMIAELQEECAELRATIPGYHPDDGSEGLLGRFEPFSVNFLAFKEYAETFRSLAHELKAHKRLPRSNSIGGCIADVTKSLSSHVETEWHTASQGSDPEENEQESPAWDNDIKDIEAEWAVFFLMAYAIRGDPNWPNISEERQMEIAREIARKKLVNRKNWRIERVPIADIRDPKVLDILKSFEADSVGNDDDASGLKPSALLDRLERLRGGYADDEMTKGQPAEARNGIPAPRTTYPIPYSLEDRLRATMNSLYDSTAMSRDDELLGNRPRARQQRGRIF